MALRIETPFLDLFLAPEKEPMEYLCDCLDYTDRMKNNALSTKSVESTVLASSLLWGISLFLFSLYSQWQPAYFFLCNLGSQGSECFHIKQKATLNSPTEQQKEDAY